MGAKKEGDNFKNFAQVWAAGLVFQGSVEVQALPT
jgi:hypothetical protein